MTVVFLIYVTVLDRLNVRRKILLMFVTAGRTSSMADHRQGNVAWDESISFHEASTRLNQHEKMISKS